MSGIDLRNGGVTITEGKETVSLSREELSHCRHSQDVVQTLEAKLGHSLKHYYYFKYNAIDDGWECSSGPAGYNLQPKEVIKEVPVTEFVERVIEKEVIKEVPVEKIVYVSKPVEVEVEKIVEKKVVEYVDKPVYIEKPVDRIVEREKKIYVERVVETPVEKIVEVPVEPTMKALWNKWVTKMKESL